MAITQKPGSIVTTELHLDNIDRKEAVNIGKNPSGVRGSPVLTAGVLSPRAYKVKRMAIAGSGNQNNANWRQRHGGSWVMPPSTKFKLKGK